MKNLHNYFDHYLEQKMSGAPIDEQLMQQLQPKASPASEPKRRWWKFTVPLVAMAAMAGTIIMLSQHTYKPGSITNAIANTLKPQEALAAAIQNAINVEAFQRTLGLPDDGQLHHRQVTYSYNDKSDTSLPTGTQTIDLWTDGNNIRQDVSYTSSDYPEYPIVSSELVNVTTGSHCVEYKASSYNCTNLTDELDHKADVFKALDDPANFNSFIRVQTEQLINNFTVESSIEDNGETGLRFTWSTAQAMTTPQITTRYIYPGSISSNGGSAESLGERDGQYWYQKTLHDRVLSRLSDLYVQVDDAAPYHFNPDHFDPLQVLTTSMLYRVPAGQLTLTPVQPDDFTSAIHQSSITEDIMNGSYTIALEPVLYTVQHLDQFTDPESTTTDVINEETVTTLHYHLPDGFLFQSRIGPDEGNYMIDFYLSEDQSTFLGYNLTKDGRMIQDAWLRDAVVDNDQDNSQLFDVETWQQTFKQTE